MFRRDFSELLGAGPISLVDLAALLEQPLREVEEDLRHFIRTLKAQAKHLEIQPAECRRCGFHFSPDKLHKPSRCPRCKSDWIRAPRFRLDTTASTPSRERYPVDSQMPHQTQVEIPMPTQTASDILDFWFAAEHRRLWFDSTPAFDALIREQFLSLWQLGRDGGLDHWATDAKGALALVILLDQFPLNMFRGDPLAFSTEARARRIAAEAIEAGFEPALEGVERSFLYLPFMHSEEAADQERSVALFAAAGLEDGLRWARHHQEIIQRFGRFPHRNAILGRPITPEESVYLASSGAFLG